jgi:hypothetical protein
MHFVRGSSAALGRDKRKRNDMTSTVSRTNQWLFAALGCLLLTITNAASPAAESQFISQAKAAFDTKDSARLLALVCWDNVEDSMKQGIEQQFRELVKLEPETIKLVPADPKEQYEYSRGGVTYRTNLAVSKQLKINFKPGNPLNTTEATMPLGEKEGRLFVTTAVPAK